MGLLEWLGGVKKSQYDEAIARCDVIEENLKAKEQELSRVDAENAQLRRIHSARRDVRTGRSRVRIS